MSSERERLGEVVWVLNGLQGFIRTATEALRDVSAGATARGIVTGNTGAFAAGGPGYSAALMLNQQVHLLLCSFLDEWTRLERLGRDEDGVRLTLRAAAPAVRRIRRWPDLDRVRNLVLAHPFRTKNGQVVDPIVTMASANAPTTFAETTLLGWCAVHAGLVATTRHRAEFLAYRSRMIADRAGRVPPVRGIGTLQEVEDELAVIRTAIEALDPELIKLPENGPTGRSSGSED